MKMILIRTTQILTVFTFLTGCSGVEFQGQLAGQYELENSAFFPLSSSEINFKQVNSFNNQMTLQLNLTQVGEDVTAINRDMINVVHSGVPINNFNLVNTSLQKDNVIDIAFVVDVTGTMSAFIEDAKARLISFIRTTTASGIRTRMCISTFGDYTVKRCDRFFDNDPSNPNSQAQTEELISEISSLRAFQGQGQDPGWPDFDENPMQAIIDVSTAPFRPEAQKFVIMVTDAGFLYSPQNQGSLGAAAPNMNRVAQAIQDSQITIFGITPYLPGYTSDLNGLPSIIEQSNGEHYLFQSVINGETTLNQILDRVLDRVKSTFVLTYDIDDQPGLDPNMPVNYQDVRVTVKDTSSQVILEDLKVQATFPNGRPDFIQEWTLSYEKIDPTSVEVWVNQRKLDRSQFDVENSRLKVKQPPGLADNITVRYKYEDNFKNIRTQPIFLNRAVKEEELQITINNITARASDILLQRDLNRDVSIMILPHALQDDFYEVEKFQGVKIEVK